MKEYKTPGGKTLAVYKCPIFSNMKVKLKEGGKVPVELSGTYTSEGFAEIAIVTYLAKNKERQEKVEVKKEAKKEKEEKPTEEK